MEDKQNKKNSLQETIKISRTRFEQQKAANAELFGSISKALKALAEEGKNTREEDQKRQNDYYEGLIQYIDTLDPGSALAHLKSEKAKYEKKLIKANIDRDGHARKSYETLIEVTIKPLIAIWEDMNLQNKHTDQAPVVEEVQSPIKHSENTMSKKNEIPNEIHSEKAFINCAALIDQIRDYFYILTKELNPSNGKPYMNKEDVDQLIKANFTPSPAVTPHKYFDLNLAARQKGILRYFVYQFYLKYELDQIGTKYKYVNFLIRNFKLFKDDDPDILNGNMNSSKRPSDKNIIAIDKYLNIKNG